MTSSLDLGGIVFLDIEASGLGPGSFPIEVGWAFLAGGSGALLIRPEANWHLSSWDEVAEALHGLTLHQLQQEGRPARDVAEALNQLLVRSPRLLVLSDAPAADGAWLRVLYEATPEGQAFKLQDEACARDLILGADQILPEEAVDTADPPRIHRAESDACLLATIWRHCLGLP